MKLAFFGDRHISAKLPRYRESLRCWDWAIQDAIEQGATAFVGLGDLCEADVAVERELPELMERVRVMRRVTERHPVQGLLAEVEGNHDPRGGIRWIEKLGGDAVWDQVFVQRFAECVLVLFPYFRRGYAPYQIDPGLSLTEAYAEANRQIAFQIERARIHAAGRPVLVGAHWTVEGMTVGPSEFELTGGKELIMRHASLEHATRVFVGHVHRAQDRGKVHGVGSMHRVTFAETGQAKSYTLVTVEHGHVEAERRIIPTRPMVDTRIAGHQCAEIVASLVAESIEQDVKLTIDIAADDTENYDAILAPLRKLPGHYTWETVRADAVRSRAPEIAQATSLGQEVDIWAGATSRVIEPAVREDLDPLLGELEAAR